jgi:lysozyme family protein
MKLERLIEELLEREGGYVNHPNDRGGPTIYGITEAVARAHGYTGAMRSLPREEAVAIYKRLYWLRPKFDSVEKRSQAVAAELFDTGVNMGPAVAVTFLQRALSALDREQKDYADLVPDVRIGPARLTALDGFLKVRGKKAARRFCFGRSMRSRAKDTFAWPNGARPTKPSYMAGSLTVLE